MTYLTNNFIKYTKNSIDYKDNIDVFFVGLSHTIDKNGNILEAFCESTNSGKIIKQITNNIFDDLVHKTNLVKGVPIDKFGKIRYPTKSEKYQGLESLKNEIEQLKPSFVFLFGRQVYDFVTKNLDIEHEYKNSLFLYKYHPSYISIYKRRYLNDYINNILINLKYKNNLGLNYMPEVNMINFIRKKFIREFQKISFKV